MTLPHVEALSILGSCDNDHCSALGQYLVDMDVPIEALGYEDVFYPLRHHHKEGLALELASRAGGATLVWGAGDYIYQVKSGLPRSDWPVVDPFEFWRDINAGLVDLDVTIVDEASDRSGHGEVYRGP